MDRQSLRKQFSEFAGPETLDRFLFALHRNPVCRRRLLFWQEKLWGEFRAGRVLEEFEHRELLDLFTFCHLHEQELSAGNAGKKSSFYDEHMDRSSLFYRNACRRLEWRCFPFAVYPPREMNSGSGGQSRRCPDCAREKRRYVEGAHRAALSLADHDKAVCDIEQECLEIYERLGEGFSGGRMEGLGLYYVERRPDRPPADPVLAGLAGRLDKTARAILAASDLLLKEDPALERLGAFLKKKEERIDVEENIDSLKPLFSLEVKSDEDLETLQSCKWLYFVLCELRNEQQS